MKPLENVDDADFESNFEAIHETDARDVTIKGRLFDPYSNMDDKKWDDVIKEATELGYIKDTRECEELEEMLRWDNLLPDNKALMISAPQKLFLPHRFHMLLLPIKLLHSIQLICLYSGLADLLSCHFVKDRGEVQTQRAQESPRNT